MGQFWQRKELRGARTSFSGDYQVALLPSDPMRAHNESARAVGVIVAATVALLVGCQASEPLVPPAVSQQVNDDGREHTYDTAWQNIRKLNADIQAGDVSGLAKDSLFIASQMDRLESGRAGSLGNRHTAELVELVAAETASRTTDANRQAIASAAQSLQDSFDFGNFATARDFALEVHVIARDSAG